MLSQQHRLDTIHRSSTRQVIWPALLRSQNSHVGHVNKMLKTTMMQSNVMHAHSGSMPIVRIYLPLSTLHTPVSRVSPGCVWNVVLPIIVHCPPGLLRLCQSQICTIFWTAQILTMTLTLMLHYTHQTILDPLKAASVQAAAVKCPLHQPLLK